MTRERLYIIIFGCAALLCGIIYRYSSTFEHLFSVKDEILIKEKQLIKHHRLVGERNDLESRLISLTRTLERVETGLLKGETRALAAVEIQNMINDIAGSNQLEIKTMRVLSPKSTSEEEEIDAARYINIPIQVGIQSDIRQLQGLLYNIQGSPKLLRIETIRIRMANSQKPQQIHTTLTVAGFMKQK